MTEHATAPLLTCTSADCGRALYGTVVFCPFCGARQTKSEPLPHKRDIESPSTRIDPSHASARGKYAESTSQRSTVDAEPPTVERDERSQPIIHASGPAARPEEDIAQILASAQGGVQDSQLIPTDKSAQGSLIASSPVSGTIPEQRTPVVRKGRSKALAVALAGIAIVFIATWLSTKPSPKVDTLPSEPVVSPPIQPPPRSSARTPRPLKSASTQSPPTPVFSDSKTGLIVDPNAIVQPIAAAPFEERKRLVEAAMSASANGDTASLDRAIGALDGMPKPARGNRTRARRLNNEALAMLNAKRYGDASSRLQEAVSANRRDEEILNNLGFALLSSGRLDESERVLIDTLTLAPRRANAWMNLGMVFGKRSSESRAIEAYVTAHRFSGAPQKAIATLVKMASDPEEHNPVAREAARKAAEKITGNDLAALLAPPSTEQAAVAADPPRPSPRATADAASAPTADTRLVECQTLVRAGRRALGDKNYNTAISNAEEALSGLSACPGARELKADAEREKRAAIDRTRAE